MKFIKPVAVVAVGLILVEAVPDKHRSYLLPSDHSHVELPEGTTGNFSSQMAVDSGAATSAAATGTLNLLPYGLIIGQ